MLWSCKCEISSDEQDVTVEVEVKKSLKDERTIMLVRRVESLSDAPILEQQSLYPEFKILPAFRYSLVG